MTGSSEQSLYLLRHARAQPWRPGTDDFARPLTRAGQDHMRRLAKWMGAALRPPAAILCSPALRTRETFRQIARAWPGARPEVQFPTMMYETTAGGLHALAGATFETADRVMIIGHNPSLENLVMQITRADDAGAPGRMATGTLAVVQFPGGWASAGGSGRLQHWIRHRDLAPGPSRAGLRGQ